MIFKNLTFFQNSGPMIWPLLLLSIIFTLFFVERTLFLHRGQIKVSVFVDGVKNLLRKRRLLEAMTVCEETPGSVASVIKIALLNHDQGESKMRSSIQSAALVQIPILERRVATIGVAAKVAPLIGLLGTIFGMLKGFMVMQSQGGYANASMFSEYIFQAIITTAFGLALAIVAYLAHHFLYGRIRAIVHDMEWAGNEIMQFLLHDLPEEDVDEVKI